MQSFTKRSCTHLLNIFVAIHNSRITEGDVGAELLVLDEAGALGIAAAHHFGQVGKSAESIPQLHLGYPELFQLGRIARQPLLLKGAHRVILQKRGCVRGWCEGKEGD